MKVKKSYKKKKDIVLYLLAFSLGLGYAEITGVGVWHRFYVETNKVNVCFTPPSGCGVLISNELSKAMKVIYLQAYTLTSSSIVDELINAKNRGVEVKVILDKSNLYDNDAKIEELKSADIEVKIDKISGIAHNKVIILDYKKVITGSFNFSKAADKRNAENLLLIDDSAVAEQYVKNWYSRYTNSY